MSGATSGSIEVLADFATHLDPARLPDEVGTWARRGIVDTVGVMLAGAEAGVHSRLLAHVAAACAGGTRVVRGSGLQASTEGAALVAGTLAHALDYDDVGFTTWAHPSAPLTAALLALADTVDIDADTALAAYVAGFEVASAIGMAVAEQQFRSGWHVTTTLGTISAAVAASRVLGFDAARTAHAIGFAASMPVGVQANFGTDAKALHVGLAARGGVTAASMAGHGLTASPRALDGPTGFLAVLGSPGAVPALDHLGQRFDLAGGLWFKRYPSCAATHKVTDGVLDLVTAHDLRGDDVRRVRCRVSARSLLPLVYPRPASATEARFSLPYAAAVAVLDRAAGPAQYHDDRVGRPDVLAMMDRVEVSVHPEQREGGDIRTEFAEIELELADGRVLATTVHEAKGFPERPFTDAELAEKVRDCAARTMTDAEVERVVGLLTRIGELGSLRELLDAVA